MGCLWCGLVWRDSSETQTCSATRNLMLKHRSWERGVTHATPFQASWHHTPATRSTMQHAPLASQALDNVLHRVTTISATYIRSACLQRGSHWSRSSSCRFASVLCHTLLCAPRRCLLRSVGRARMVWYGPAGLRTVPENTAAGHTCPRVRNIFHLNMYTIA